MSDDFVKELEAGVDQDEQLRLRKAILAKLNGTNPTLEDLFNVCQQSKLGDVMKTITLNELQSLGQPEAEEADEEGDDEGDEETVAAAPAPRRGKKKAAKKKAPKKTAKKTAKKAAKKTAKKAAKKKAKSKSNGVSKKAGGRKPRQDYDQLAKEVIAFMKAAKKPCSTGDLTKKFSISAAQARQVMDRLKSDKKVKRLGASGRGVKYELR